MEYLILTAVGIITALVSCAIYALYLEIEYRYTRAKRLKIVFAEWDKMIRELEYRD